MSQKQELIEQNDGYFRIQRPQITLKKLFYTLQQTKNFFCRPVFFVSDEPKLRNHGYQKNDGPFQVAVSPPDVIKKKMFIYFGMSFIICVKSRTI